MMEKINCRTMQISSVQHESQAEFMKSMLLLQKVVVSLGENGCPTAFVILPPPGLRVQIAEAQLALQNKLVAELREEVKFLQGEKTRDEKEWKESGLRVQMMTG